MFEDKKMLWMLSTNITLAILYKNIKAKILNNTYFDDFDEYLTH